MTPQEARDWILDMIETDSIDGALGDYLLDVLHNESTRQTK